MLRKLSKYVLLGALILLLASVTGLLVLRAVGRHQAEKHRRITAPTGIDVIERVRLGD